MDCPTIEEGVAGMVFIEDVVASSANHAAWTPLDYTPTQPRQLSRCDAEY